MYSNSSMHDQLYVKYTHSLWLYERQVNRVFSGVVNPPSHICTQISFVLSLLISHFFNAVPLQLVALNVVMMIKNQGAAALDLSAGISRHVKGL